MVPAPIVKEIPVDIKTPNEACNNSELNEIGTIDLEPGDTCEYKITLKSSTEYTIVTYDISATSKSDQNNSADFILNPKDFGDGSKSIWLNPEDPDTVLEKNKI